MAIPRPNERIIEQKSSQNIGPLPHEAVTQDILDFSKDQIRFVQEKAISPEPLLALAIEHAKKRVRELQKILLGEQLETTTAAVTFLSQEDFTEIRRQIFGTDPSPDNDTLALSIHPFPSVLVKLDTKFPLHQQGGFVLHELIHRDLDASVRTYAQIADPDNFGLPYINTRESRSGLEIRSEKYQRGKLLNEIGNILEEMQFEKALLQMPEFAAEKAFQKYRLHDWLKEIGESDSTRHITFVYQAENKEVPIEISVSNLRFQNDGQPGYGLMLICQLSREIASKIGTVNGESFSLALLRAKADPQYQNILRVTIDKAYGEGFFSQLRRAQMNEIEVLHLLYFVQQKR